MKSPVHIKATESNLFERIRRRPAMFFGKNSLSAFRSFVDGYYYAHYQLGAEPPSLLPEDMHDWAAYRLHFHESTSGYANMILKDTPDEAQALTRFFELLDEHRARQPKLVAKIRRHPQDHEVIRAGVGPNGELVRGAGVPQADEVIIVVYTDDPGFFVINGDESSDYPRRSSFCPSLSRLHKPYKPDAEFVTILNQEQFSRLLQEDIGFVHAHHEAKEARQLKLKEQQGKIN